MLLMLLMLLQLMLVLHVGFSSLLLEGVRIHRGESLLWVVVELLLCERRRWRRHEERVGVGVCGSGRGVQHARRKLHVHAGGARRAARSRREARGRRRGRARSQGP